MTETSADLLRKAEACRRLADIADDLERKTLWIERAVEWDRLAHKTAKQPRPK